MKQVWKILIVLVLLAGLLIGGSMLYGRLAPQGRVSSVGSEAPSVRHKGEYEERASEQSAAPEADDALPEPPAEPVEEPEEPAEEAPEPTVALGGDLTADFSVLDESGNTVSLSDYFGTPIVVNLWATWCPPCRAELPYFDAAASRYEGQVRFMMVDLTDGATDTVDSATAFAREENGYGFPLYFDVDFSAVDAYQVNAIPVTLFIRADGSLLHQQIGSMDEKTLDGYIQQLLADQ